MRLWKALTTPKATKPPVEPPKPPVAPRASAALREEFEKLERAKAAKEAERIRLTEQRAAEAAREERIATLRMELNRAFDRAADDPEVAAILDHNGVQASGVRSRSELAESTGWQNARSQIAALDAERAQADQPAPSSPQLDPTSQPAPRRKSGPSGPGF